MNLTTSHWERTLGLFSKLGDIRKWQLPQVSCGYLLHVVLVPYHAQDGGIFEIGPFTPGVVVMGCKFKRTRERSFRRLVVTIINFKLAAYRMIIDSKHENVLLISGFFLSSILEGQ